MAPSRVSPATVVAPAKPPADGPPDLVIYPGELEQQVTRNRQEEEAAEKAAEKGSRDFFSVPGKEGTEGGAKEPFIPTGLTARVDKFIRYFQTAGRKKFELYLQRSGKYSDSMKDILSRYGLPGDLIYVALIESGFSPKAYSVAKAAGPWQFIAETGRRYGLRIDWWADERRDFEKSTHAAASYLKDLYGLFESWPLAAAAYNAGEGKIMRAVTKYNSEDYSELIRYGYLKQETKDYVPKMLAALVIGKEPEKYGFGDVKPEEPLAFDKVVVPGGTDLAELGRIIGVPYDTLREWNPEIKRFCTPPNQQSYEIRLPKDYGAVAVSRMEEIRNRAKVTFLLHATKKRETLESLARDYGTTVPVLKELNGLKRNGLGKSSKLIIPITGLAPEDAVPGRELTNEQLEMAHMRAEEAPGRARASRGGKASRTVRVRKGDTLEKIASSRGLTVEELARANGMTPGKKLRAGQRLKLPTDGDAGDAGAVQAKAPASHARKREVRHIVRKGETLERIARFYGIGVPYLEARNRLKPGQTLPRGRVLFIPAES